MRSLRVEEGEEEERWKEGRTARVRVGWGRGKVCDAQDEQMTGCDEE